MLYEIQEALEKCESFNASGYQYVNKGILLESLFNFFSL
jgi:hypothetical protein